ncbi:MAG: arginine repressor [Candidatus Dormibacteraeota bacterium]|nr:arginine repressor [Candidatus Dormibacteraeota bacterium]
MRIAGQRAALGHTKQARQWAILDTVRTRAVYTQEELATALRARRFEVTQATVSRDIRELGLLRVPGDGGTRYVAPAAELDENAALRRLGNALREHSLGIELIDLLAVVRAQPGSASLLAAAIDSARFDELAGTIAGDDTVLLIARSRPAAQRLLLRLRAISEDSR